MFARKTLVLWFAGLFLMGTPSWVSAQRGSRKMSQAEFEKRARREGDGYFASHDRNKNGTLDRSEMSSRLRREYKKYDRNRDGQISRREYTPYIRGILERRYGMKSSRRTSSAKPGVATVDHSTLEKRPIVYRAGNLPEGLPDWFTEIDQKTKGGDGDGQIGLYEWRRAGKDLSDFSDYDRNDDGFLTAEEMLFHYEHVTKAGYTSLGKDLSRWQVDTTQARAWKSLDGTIHYTGKGGRNLRTTREYGNFELWLDWKISKGGDSGVYLRGKPQVQIWDRREGSGGLYDNKRGTTGQRPRLRADKSPGQWNTYYIKMIGDKVTVKLNGKLVVDNVQMLNGDVPKTGPIELQSRGRPLWFRNIYIKELTTGG